jgi:ABC-type antimicrobial peptide transport system permease subunit
VTPRHFIGRSLRYYWRTNAVVVAGVATAVAVLSGALVVGDSVRGTLRHLALARLGAVDLVVTAPRFVGEDLARAMAEAPEFAPRFTGLCPLIALPAMVTAQTSGARAGGVVVYGVDERFWTFHRIAGIGAPDDRGAFISPALAAETGLAAGEAALLRVERPSAVPLESLHGDKDTVGRTIRLTVAKVLADDALAEFSWRPQQGEVRAVFVSLRRLQAELGVEGRVNTLIVSAASSAPGGVADVDRLVREHARIGDVGLEVRALAGRNMVSIESTAGLLDEIQTDAVEAALSGTALEAVPVMSYVANTLQVGARVVPYSVVTATDLAAVAPGATAGMNAATAPPPIVLNDWTAADLQAGRGDLVRMEYYVWEDAGRLGTRTAEFQVAGVVPVRSEDRDFAPPYRGITDSPTIDAWDPPFPVDLRRIRPRDEAYWQRYRTAPKAFLPLDVGQRLWSSRHGALTALRVGVLPGRGPEETVRAFEDRLQTKIDPVASGMSIADVRGPALSASEGATDFGEYFLYFSFFLVVAALVLASLFFKLGVEARSREVGLLGAVGLDRSFVRRLFLSEAAVLSVAGSLLGLMGAYGYATLVVAALRTWWHDAVGTTALTVHVTAISLAAGALGGIVAAIACTAWTLRDLSRVTERSLLAGTVPGADAATSPRAARRAFAGASISAGVAAAFVAGSRAIGLTAAFFGAGGAVLVTGLLACAYAYRLPGRTLGGRGWRAVSRLGLRGVSYRPARSVLSVGVVAAATFILIAVDAFRRDTGGDGTQSDTGGYELLVESLLPIAHDPRTPEGQRALNLSGLGAASIEAFRLRPGDDASCLNLYAPQNPRVLGVSESFVDAARFGFQAALAENDAERRNPWRLLHRPLDGGAIPVIADITSMTYVLHRAVGDEIVLRRGGRPVRLRFVAALSDSVFQSELLMSDANFRAIFPEHEGYRVLLIDVPPDRATDVTREIENVLADHGADVSSTAARLARFHRVENTYLATFQTLGGLGLVIGTVGLAAVLLRNVLERRRELALLGAVGFRRRHFVLMLTAESLSLVLVGLAIGAGAAALAIAPAVAERGGRVPVSSGGLLLVAAVLAAGLIATLAAARLATRGPILSSLRAE